MKELNIREMRTNMGCLDELVAEEGEWVISFRQGLDEEMIFVRKA